MGLHNAPRDVQAQAQSTPVVLADLPEPLEYGLQHRRGDSFTGVVHAKFKRLSDAFTVDADTATLGSELDRIGDQVGEDLQHTIVIEFRQARFLQHPAARGTRPLPMP